MLKSLYIYELEAIFEHAIRMNYPIRHTSHILETQSKIFLRNHVPIDWVLNEFHIDYGTDFNCEIAKKGFVTGTNFTIQLKAKEKDGNPEYITISIKRSTINRWINRLEPTMLVVFIQSESEAYWIWFEEDTVNLTKKNKEFQIKISRLNKVSAIDWESINRKLEEVFSRKHWLYEIPRATLDLNEETTWANFFDGHFEKALIGLKIMIETKGSPILWNAISVCHYQVYHYQDALIAINKALQDLPTDNILLLNKAAILTEMGISAKDTNKLKAAVEIYERLIEKQYVSADLYYNYANALNTMNLKERAFNLFLECLRLSPNKAEAWKNLGSLYHDFGLFEQELECYEFALQINPSLQEALLSKGITLLKVYENVEEGLELMLKSVSISPKLELQFPYAYFWIAEAFLKQNKIEEAQDYNQRCLNLMPKDEYALLQAQRIQNCR